MKTHIFFFSALAVVFLLSCNNPPKQTRPLPDKNKNQNTENLNAYDSAFAEEIKADEFGMTSYFMVFLIEKDTLIRDTVKQQEIQKAHLANIRALAREKKLVLAGSFLDNEDLAGLFIFDSDSLTEVLQITKNDPAVEAGLVNFEITQWYGPASLRKVYDIHPRAAKIHI